MVYKILLISICVTSVLGNFYEILGVSRSATDFDIKKSYKKLARIWHPDKNRSPEASSHFTKINEAYEALSNPDKRREYDAFGSISNENRDQQRHQNNFWGGGNAYFDFGQNDHSESNFESTNYRQYKIDILPNSYKQPTLILLVSHFCFSCHHAMRLWSNIATQITESGIRMTLCDVMGDAHLRDELRIQHVPTVVMIIDGEVRYLQSEINKETVVDFIRFSFPRDLIETVQSDSELNYFHNLWSRDSRSKMIMAKPLDRPSFRYLSVAFKYRDKISAAFINIGLDDSRSKKVSNAYGLRMNEETVMIFHDEKQYYSNNLFLPKPIIRRSQTRLSLSDMDSMAKSHHLLPFPRLLSQSIFDIACPAPSQKHRSFGFCAITIVHSKHKNNLSQSESWQYVRSLIGDQGYNGKMLYLFGDVQYQFLQSLGLVDSDKSSVDAFMDQVILLWRQSYTSATSLFLSNPWQYSNLEMVLENWDLLSNFDKAVSILKTRTQIQPKIRDSETLSELVDELAAPLWMKIGSRLFSYTLTIYIYLYEFVIEPVNLIVLVMGLALASYVYSTVKAVSSHISADSGSPNPPNQRPEQPKSSKMATSGATIPEITNDMYCSLLQYGQSGRLVCLLLVSDSTPVEVLLLLQDSVAKLKCNDRLSALSLPLHTHPSWLKSLVARVANDDDHRSALSSISSLSLNRPYADEGIVLALNFNRSNISICPINLLHAVYGSTVSRDARRKRPLDVASSFDLDSSDSESSTGPSEEDSRAPVDVHSRFFDWLGQLMEGSCRRYHVDRWPSHL